LRGRKWPIQFDALVHSLNCIPSRTGCRPPIQEATLVNY
jgi:hypothetical protein